mgnify:CR=1 FL=1
MAERIRVLIADDNLPFREGLKRLLSLDPGIELIGEALSAHEATQRARDERPDVVLMDLAWHKDNTAGCSAIRLIKQIAPEVRILAMTAYIDLIKAARQAGAEMAVDKDNLDSPERLVHLIRETARSEAFVIPSDASIEALNERELQILRLMADGDTDEAIAIRLNLSVGAVKRGISEIYQKLDAVNRPSAVARGFERGILRRNSGR